MLLLLPIPLSRSSDDDSGDDDGFTHPSVTFNLADLVLYVYSINFNLFILDPMIHVKDLRDLIST